jgi:hypothetical protein
LGAIEAPPPVLDVRLAAVARFRDRDMTDAHVGWVTNKEQLMKPLTPVALCAVAILLTTGSASAAARPPSCGSDVGVNVTLAGTPSAANAQPDAQLGSTSYNLVSDGLGAYNNGTRSKGGTLEAHFQVDNCTYDFTVNLNNLSRKMFARTPAGSWVEMGFFNFDRIASVPITASDTAGNLTDPKAIVFCNDGAIVYDPADPGRPLTDANGVHDNYGGCHTDAAGNWYVLRAANMSLIETKNGSTSTRLLFSPSPLDYGGAGVCPGPDSRCATSMVRVYHPAPNTWTMTPNDLPNQQPSPAPNPPFWISGHMTCGNACSLDAYWSVPFRMTVVRQ